MAQPGIASENCVTPLLVGFAAQPEKSPSRGPLARLIHDAIIRPYYHQLSEVLGAAVKPHGGKVPGLVFAQVPGEALEAITQHRETEAPLGFLEKASSSRNLISELRRSLTFEYFPDVPTERNSIEECILHNLLLGHSASYFAKGHLISLTSRKTLEELRRAAAHEVAHSLIQLKTKLISTDKIAKKKPLERFSFAHILHNTGWAYGIRPSFNLDEFFPPFAERLFVGNVEEIAPRFHPSSLSNTQVANRELALHYQEIAFLGDSLASSVLFGFMLRPFEKMPENVQQMVNSHTQEVATYAPRFAALNRIKELGTAAAIEQYLKTVSRLSSDDLWENHIAPDLTRPLTEVFSQRVFDRAKAFGNDSDISPIMN